MCERRAQLLLQQQAVVEATSANKETGTFHTGGKSYLFRNPFKTCKNLTYQCCSPLCDSHRTSIASVRPSPTPENSDELSLDLRDDIYRVSESPLSAEPLQTKENQPPESKTAQVAPEPAGEPVEPRRKRRGLLTRLKLLTYGVPLEEPIKSLDHESSGTDSSFTACAKKVIAVAEDLDHGEHHVREIAFEPASVATFLAAESSLDTISEDSFNVSESNISETTMLSMMNMNGSFSSPFELSHRGSTLKSSTYDDDASTFAIVPRTSLQSSFIHEWASDASGLSDRFGELDIGYLSLEESGEGPDFDDTVSISSSQHDDLDLHMHPQDDVVSESDLDQDYSIGTDSQEWCTETEDAASLLDRSRGHHRTRSKNHLHLHLPDLRTTPPHDISQPKDDDLHLPELQATPPHDLSPPPLPMQQSRDVIKGDVSLKEDPARHEPDAAQAKVEEGCPPEKNALRPETKCTEFLCSQCGRKEKRVEVQDQQRPSTRSVISKDNPMSAYFHNMDGSKRALIADKVVVLLGKYGNRKGLRVAGFSPGRKESHDEVALSANELDRLRSMICPKKDAVTSFQSEVARMMLEGVDAPDLNMDVEQFIAGYMKLNSPFYIDLIEDFFKSVCIDCFGHMGAARRAKSSQQRPALTVLKPKRGTKSAVKNTGKR